MHFFTSQNIQTSGTQNGTNCYGPKSSDVFRLSSGFSVAGTQKIPIYAVLKGTVLLQQQTNNSNLVNLILKPTSSENLKVNIKYFIYRGLDINDFIVSNVITASTNKVVSSGCEYINRMHQSHKNTGGDIPVGAFFGKDLSPSLSTPMDELFTAATASQSQVWECLEGEEIGYFNFNTECSIDIVLESNDYYPDVEMARLGFFELNTSSFSDPIEKRWNKELIRNFIDPAAFYGLHSNTQAGIGYHSSSGKTTAVTITDIHDFILNPFFTKNNIYLDLRSEFGYSYNCYSDYGNQGDDTIQIADSVNNLAQKDHLTDGWPIKLISTTEIASGSTMDESWLKLKITNNGNPMVYSETTKLDPFSKNLDDRTFFIYETDLLDPNDITWTKSFKLSFINNPSASVKQISTHITIYFLKKPIVSDSLINSGSVIDSREYIFGPLQNSLADKTGFKTKWSSTNSNLLSDSSNQGFARTTTVSTILATVYDNNVLLGVTIDREEAQYIDIYTRATLVAGSTTVPIDIKGMTPANFGAWTTLWFHTGKSVQIQPGDEIHFTSKFAVYVDRFTDHLIIPAIDISNRFTLGNKIYLYTFFHSESDRPFEIINSQFDNGNTLVGLNRAIGHIGFIGTMSSGVACERDDASSADPDRICFYAVPNKVVKGSGIPATDSINFQYGAINDSSFFLHKVIEIYKGEKRISREQLEVVDYSQSPPVSSIEFMLVHYGKYINLEEFYFLGMLWSEYELLKTVADIELFKYHKYYFNISLDQNVTNDQNQMYIQYTLTLHGIDTNGGRKVCSESIKLYSLNGLIFTTTGYAASFEEKATTNKTGVCQSCSSLTIDRAWLDKFMIRGMGRTPIVLQSEKDFVDSMVPYLNEYMEKYDIKGNCNRMAHFLGITANETGFWKVSENFNYWKNDLGIFKTALANKVRPYARAEKDGPPVSHENQIKIANILYAGPNNDLGNTVVSDANIGDPNKDGYKFRGKGLGQVTGRGNYTAMNTWYAKVRNDLGLPAWDFTGNDADKFLEPRYAALSAIAYWVRNNLEKIADKGTTNEIVDELIWKTNAGVMKGVKEGRQRSIEIRDKRRKLTQVAKSMIGENALCKIANPSKAEAPSTTTPGSTKWVDPVENPRCTLYMAGGGGGAPGKHWGLFGMMRWGLNKAKTATVAKVHHGLDLFAPKGTPVKACLSGKVSRVQWMNGYGNTLAIKIDEDGKKEFAQMVITYELLYPDSIATYNGVEIKEYPGATYDGTSDVYLFYAHLNSVDVKIDEEVKTGQAIASAGVSGVKGGTRAPHLHFEIWVRDWSELGGFTYRINPGKYVRFKSYDQQTAEERKQQADQAAKNHVTGLYGDK